MADSTWWADLASAGLGVAGSLVANSQNASNQQALMHQNEQFTQDMYALQYRHAMEAENRADERWYKQVDYNQQAQLEYQKALLDYVYKNYESPEAQAAALRAAGINPSALIAGGKSPFGNVASPGGNVAGLVSGVGSNGVVPFGSQSTAFPQMQNPLAVMNDFIPQLAKGDRLLRHSLLTWKNSHMLLPIVV